MNLGLCYAALASRQDLRCCLLVGKAAFLCCAYDVVTDWRGYGAGPREAFAIVLRSVAPTWTVGEALDLFDRDKKRTLGNDGLERGVIAVKLIVRSASAGGEVPVAELEELGTLLQIVDDVLDLEQDREREEENCLLGPRAREHLQALLVERERLCRRFRTSPFMRVAVSRALAKAEVLLSEFDRGSG